MIQFFTTYFLLLLFGSIIINGWYEITREGMLFQFWSKFWDKKKGIRKINVEGENLYKKYREIEKVAQSAGYSGAITFHETHLKSDNLFNSYKIQVEYHLLVHLNIIEEKSKLLIQLYEEEPIFKFSEHVRNPVSSCIICMASLYGSAIFWTTQILSDENIYLWANNYYLAVTLTWIVYCISLAPINYFIHKQIQ